VSCGDRDIPNPDDAHMPNPNGAQHPPGGGHHQPDRKLQVSATSAGVVRAQTRMTGTEANAVKSES
jgi:hypothetical protein